MSWRYIRQINHFFRIEELREGKDPRIVCFTQNEADAKFICHVVNTSGKTVEMFAEKPKEKAEAKG